jgi:hypothetical protein
VFALNHNHDEELGKAAKAALGHIEKSFPTNV